MRVALVVALILVAMSRYAWSIRPVDAAEPAPIEAKVADSIFPPVAGTSTPDWRDDRDQTRAFGTD